MKKQKYFKMVKIVRVIDNKILWNKFNLYYNLEMGLYIREKVNKILKIKEKEGKGLISLRKQLSRTICICCVLAVCIQTIVMVAMIINQYVIREKENILYLLENDNKKVDTAFQYLSDLTIAIQHNATLKSFFQDEDYDKKTATEHLRSVADIFSSRNHLEGENPLVEEIYLFSANNQSICNLYYPKTNSEMEELLCKYQLLHRDYKANGKNFYVQISEKNMNLYLKLYDNRMNELGDCIFVLNKNVIEDIFSNLEKMKIFHWKISQGEEKLLGKESFVPKENSNVYEHSLSIGFGMKSYVAVHSTVVYRSLAVTISMVLIVSVLLIGMLSFWVYFMAVRYVRPLEDVAEKIKLVGKGKFDTKLEQYKVEELQNISNTFNEMTAYIERLINEVYETKLIAKQAEIQYLQAQIDPHFLFNVLTMIKMKAAINQDEEVQEMLYKLSCLYQGKIFRKDEYFIYLEEEIEIVDFYLSLQSNRFGEKINYKIDYKGKKEDYVNLMVPRLSIEPIVENALRHGLEPKVENGRIEVYISKDEHILNICVEDNGVGFDLDKIEEKKEDKAHNHVGLWNTDKMIRNLCGKNFGLKINSKIGEGTKVCILLPIRSGEVYVESNDC